MAFSTRTTRRFAPCALTCVVLFLGACTWGIYDGRYDGGGGGDNAGGGGDAGPTPCGAQIQTLTSGQAQPQTLLFVSTRQVPGILFSTAGGTIFSMNTDGSDDTSLGSFFHGDSPYGVAFAQNTVFWADQTGFVASCPFDVNSRLCGTPTIFTMGQTPAQGVAVDGTSVYWTSSAGLFKCPLGAANCTPTQLSTTQTSGGYIALDDAYVYWTSDNAVERCSKAGCSQSSVMLATTSFGGAYGLALDSGNVYYTTGGGQYAYQVPADGSSAPVMLGQGPPGGVPGREAGIVIDAPHGRFYWAALGEIAWCPLSGCPSSGPNSIAPIRTSGNNGANVAIDDNCVYWTDQAAGTVSSVLKPQ